MSENLGKWLQIGSSVGIIVGLVLVAVEMRQNSQLVRMQLIQEETNSYIAGEMAIAGENFAEFFQKMLEEPENLTLSEMRVIESDYWGHTMYRWLGAYKLYEEGLYEAEAWQSMVDNDALFMFGNPFGRAWWDAARTGASIPKEMIEYIDAALTDVSLDATEAYFRDIQNGSKKYSPDQ